MGTLFVGEWGVALGDVPAQTASGVGSLVPNVGHRILRHVCCLAALGLLGTGVASSQVARVEQAALPSRAVPLPMTVSGRVEASTTPAVAPGTKDEVVYQWPGISFDAAFRGQVVYFSTGQGRQALHVSVDGVLVAKLVSTSPTTYRAAGLVDGSHRVHVMVVNESQSAPEAFRGFQIAAKDARPAPVSKQRQIEFIGDSYTVGYGNTSAERKCTQEQIWTTTDVSQSFGALTAQAYDADFQVNAISGRGVVRNYNGFAADTLPTAYPFVLFNKQERYAGAHWHPQVIVVGLGTNDFSTPLNPGERWTSREALHTDYEQTFEHFLLGLRAQQPQALLIVWATDGAKGEIESEAHRVVDHMAQAGEKRIQFVPVHGLAMTGCDSHPSTADDTLISAKVREAIDSHADTWAGKP
jgi:lysophospholipase L1-like esterase